jgi:hypothetical protein
MCGEEEGVWSVDFFKFGAGVVELQDFLSAEAFGSHCGGAYLA